MNKALLCAGLAKKAGKLAAGTENVLEAIRSGKAARVIIASDASPNTAKSIKDKTGTYGVPLSDAGSTGAELGKALGMAACACAAFTDKGFADMFERAYNELQRR